MQEEAGYSSRRQETAGGGKRRQEGSKRQQEEAGGSRRRRSSKKQNLHRGVSKKTKIFNGSTLIKLVFHLIVSFNVTLKNIKKTEIFRGRES